MGNIELRGTEAEIIIWYGIDNSRKKKGKCHGRREKTKHVVGIQMRQLQSKIPKSSTNDTVNLGQQQRLESSREF